MRCAVYTIALRKRSSLAALTWRKAVCGAILRARWQERDDRSPNYSMS